MGCNIRADWDSNGMDGQVLLHRFRYHLGRGFVSPEDVVLDIGCGQGYGTEIISKVAKRVIGIDMEAPQIQWNTEHFKHLKNVKFSAGNLENISLPKADVAVAFEVIEHLYDPEAFVKKLKRNVNKWIIVSVPIGETLIDVNGDIQAKGDSTHHSNFPTPGDLDGLFIDNEWKRFFSFQTGVTYMGVYYNVNL